MLRRNVSRRKDNHITVFIMMHLLYVTVSNIPMSTPLKLSEVRPSIQGSINRLGFIPDLFLIHSPMIAAPGELKAMWKIFEELKDEGKLKSIGVSNFQPQDIEAIVDGCKYIPVVNQVRRAVDQARLIENF